MQEMCGFEISAWGESPWCDVFTHEDWYNFQYARDIIHYYRAGPGKRFWATMGLLWLNATADLLKKGPDAGKLFFSLWVVLVPLHTDLLYWRCHMFYINLYNRLPSWPYCCVYLNTSILCWFRSSHLTPASLVFMTETLSPCLRHSTSCIRPPSFRSRISQPSVNGILHKLSQWAVVSSLNASRAPQTYQHTSTRYFQIKAPQAI